MASLILIDIDLPRSSLFCRSQVRSLNSRSGVPRNHNPIATNIAESLFTCIENGFVSLAVEYHNRNDILYRAQLLTVGSKIGIPPSLSWQVHIHQQMSVEQPIPGTCPLCRRIRCLWFNSGSRHELFVPYLAVLHELGIFSRVSSYTGNAYPDPYILLLVARGQPPEAKFFLWDYACYNQQMLETQYSVDRQELAEYSPWRQL